MREQPLKSHTVKISGHLHVPLISTHHSYRTCDASNDRAPTTDVHPPSVAEPALLCSLSTVLDSLRVRTQFSALTLNRFRLGALSGFRLWGYLRLEQRTHSHSQSTLYHQSSPCIATRSRFQGQMQPEDVQAVKRTYPHIISYRHRITHARAAFQKSQRSLACSSELAAHP